MLVALHRRVNDRYSRVARTVVDSGPTVTEGSIITIFAESVRWARFAMHRPRTPKRAILIDIAFGGG
jgi:hypothetical protein